MLKEIDGFKYILPQKAKVIGVITLDSKKVSLIFRPKFTSINQRGSNPSLSLKKWQQ